ncbi:MAG: acyl-CoA dehydrogenase family protein, partial [Acidimicrobiia bacterium]
MDFAWSEEQQQHWSAVVEFARGELNRDVIERDGSSSFSRDAWKSCGDFGIQGLPIPTEFGGTAADPVTIMVIMEGLGYACEDNGLIFSLNAQMWSCEMPILTFGTQEQKMKYLPGLCDGSLIAAHGMTEPGSGSDAFSLATTAQEKADGYILNGSKAFVTNAPEADVFVVFATTDHEKGFAGLCAFLVDRDAAGLIVGRPLSKMGLRTSPMAEVFLEDCFVRKDQMLGTVGAGMAMFNSSMEWERSCILASAVGTMQRQLDRAIAYARDRKQFGRPISDFQAVSHKIVEMKLSLETSRLLLYKLG